MKTEESTDRTEKGVRFTGLATGRWSAWRDGKESKGFTLFALGDDGVVYRGRFRHKEGFVGWSPIPSRVLPAQNERVETPVDAQEVVAQ